MIYKYLPFLFGVISGLFALSACQHAPRHLAPDYGQCYQSGFAAQVVNPKAPEDSSPPNSLPGDIAIQLYEQKYVKGLMESNEEDEDVASALSNVD